MKKNNYSELFNLLMRDYPVETDQLLRQYYCELDCTFVGFEDYYKQLANILPKNMTIIDIGCYMATQAYFFRGHKQYIGVDEVSEAKQYETKIDEYGMKKPTKFSVDRFSFDNTVHYTMDGNKWIQEVLPTLNLDMDKTFAICSAVPCDELQQAVISTFPNHFVWYPGKGIDTSLDWDKKMNNKESEKDLEIQR